jgi:alpha-methylacyl-CoA racemase
VIHARATGQGQVIDCAMTDGAASLMAMFYGMSASGVWNDTRRSNLLDGAAQFYDTYECSCGRWISLGSIEPQFYALLLEKAGLANDAAFKAQMDRAAWPDLKARLVTLFKTKSRDEWCSIMEATDICFAPVMSLAEAPSHPHNAARKTFVEVGGVVQPAPAPRFSATPGAVQGPPPGIGAHTDDVLADWGVRQPATA